MKELEEYRRMVREITFSIMEYTKKRFDLVKKIGEIKNELGLSIIDTNAEEELRKSVIELSDKIGLDKGFALRLLNMLIEESRKVQTKNSNSITPTQIFTKAKELEKEGKRIIHLEVGEPDLDPPDKVKVGVSEAIRDKRYRYTEAAGLKELRVAIANKLFNNINYENVMITPGGRFGIYLAISLLNEGEEIIVIDPSWPAYKDCARLAKLHVKIIKSRLEDGWNVNIHELENLINENSRMLVLNYPNNPTGKILDYNTLKEIVEIASSKNLIILSDEVYSYYSFKEFKSIAEFKDVDYILVSSFSKAYSMTGFRVGFVVSNNKEIINKMVRHQSIALTSVAEPMQYAALKALDCDYSYYKNIIKERVEYLVDRLKDLPLSFYKPDGGMYIFARVNKKGFDALEFANKLLNKGLAITPGNAFGDYKNYFRIAACSDINVLEEGLKILKESLI